MSNGAASDKKGLFYLRQVDTTFCFPCKLFNPINVVHDLLERSVRNRLSKHEIIDKELQHENIKENERLI